MRDSATTAAYDGMRRSRSGEGDGALITFVSVYLTPALSGECGQAAAQQRYINNHKGELPTRGSYGLAVRDVTELVAKRHRAGSAVVLGGDLQTDVADGSKAQSQRIRKYRGRENRILPSLDEDARPWTQGRQAKRPPTYYKGDAAIRIDDILVSASLVTANFAGGYLEMRREDTLNGSDHRAVILHLDTETFVGMPPTLPPGPCKTT